MSTRAARFCRGGGSTTSATSSTPGRQRPTPFPSPPPTAPNMAACRCLSTVSGTTRTTACPRSGALPSRPTSHPRTPRPTESVMMLSLRPLLALAAAVMLGLSGCSSSLSTTNRTLMDFDSNISSQTNNFQTPGKWDVLYSWDCSQVRSQGNLGASGFKFVGYNSDDGSTAAGDK